MSVAARVTALLVAELGVTPDEITPDSSLVEDLGCDDLDQLLLVISAEKEFSIEIPDEDTDALRTVDDVVKYIARRTEASN